MAREMTEQEYRDAQDAKYVHGAKEGAKARSEQEREALDQRQVAETKRLLSEKGAGAGGREAEKRFGKGAMASREAQEAQRQMKVRKAAGNRQRELRERGQADAAAKARTSQRDRMLDAERARRAQGHETRGR